MSLAFSIFAAEQAGMVKSLAKALKGAYRSINACNGFSATQP